LEELVEMLLLPMLEATRQALRPDIVHFYSVL